MDASTFSVVLSPDATATVQHTPGHTFVRLLGEVDESAAAAARYLVDLVVEAGRPVHVDLGSVTFFSAAGVGFLVRLYQHAGDVRVVAASAPVREVLDACGVPRMSPAGLPSPRHADTH